MIVFSHPTGNANVRAAASGLAKAGLLSEFRTSIAAFPGGMLDKLGYLGPLKDFKRRGFSPILQPVTQTWPWYELGRLLASKIGFAQLTRHEKGPFSIDAIYRKFDRKTASTLYKAKKSGVKGIYAYEDGAINSFKKAKGYGIQCFYDLPIGYWRSSRSFLQQECERWPEWTPTLVGLQDSVHKLTCKDEELRLADRIFVASSFTAKTLQDYPGNLAPVEVIPYGFPSIYEDRKYSLLLNGRPLKLLYVGSLSQRKGIADLFAAVKDLKSHVQLTVVGRKVAGQCSALDAELQRHKWIPSLPHADILKLMQVHDVLVFPSLFEGFGLVITEAMAQGTPVITTDRTAGPDLIQHDESGWLVNAGSAISLRAAIEKLLDRPRLISEVGRSAQAIAKKRSWNVYEQELAEAIKRHFQSTD